DNPFVSEEFQKEGVRPEIWAFGFRNPWKMSFDRATGDLWVGDVGWELWELVDRVEKGGNYGWSIVEGRQPVRQDVKLGPTPVLPPTIDFSHTEAASITGGFVYRGKEFPDLVGCYVCGDWETRKMWATKWENGRIGEKRSIASDTVRITDFGEDANGELYVIDFGENAGLYKLARNETDATASEKFPRKLSETGLFANVAQHVLSSGVLPFEINVEQWCDHATSERFIGLPERSTVSILNEARPIPGSMFTAKTFFPKDGVLARTFSLEMTRGKPETARRIETQILHFNGKGWQGYSYRWNDAETDAELVDAAGADQTFKIIEQGEPRTQRWHFPSRTECMQCHNPWPGYTLAFTLPQLHRPADEKLSPSGEDQVDVFKRLGMLDSLEEPRPLTFPETFNVDSPEARGRAYLHVNCSHCHQMGAGGSVDLDLRAELALDKMKIVDRKPSQGTFGIDDAQIVSSGRPYHSVLYYRMAKLGRGRMPHIGSEFVDVRGLQIIDEWIRSLAPGQERDDAAALLKSLAKGDGKWDDLAARTPDALGLLAALDGQASDEAKAKLVAHARTLPVGPVRDLFERFFPDDERAERLGATFDKAKLLAMPGDAARGRTVFFETTGVSCKNCHKIAGQDGATSAGEVGPELSAIGKKLSREQLLESLMEPSKTVDPKFAGYSLETTDGRSFVGRLVERNGERIALRDAAGKDVVVAAEDVEAFAPLPVSLMPERLLQDLSPQQAADLLAYLHSLKGE
ncbi:MAG TPA: PQQ-dependent sugar dehydrogenase, partial [Pirellulales bacterium]